MVLFHVLLGSRVMISYYTHLWRLGTRCVWGVWLYAEHYYLFLCLLSILSVSPSREHSAEDEVKIVRWRCHETEAHVAWTAL